MIQEKQYSFFSLREKKKHISDSTKVKWRCLKNKLKSISIVSFCNQELSQGKCATDNFRTSLKHLTGKSRSLLFMLSGWWVSCAGIWIIVRCAAADFQGTGVRVIVYCVSPTKMSKTSLPPLSKGHGDSETYAYWFNLVDFHLSACILFPIQKHLLPLKCQNDTDK